MPLCIDCSRIQKMLGFPIQGAIHVPVVARYHCAMRRILPKIVVAAQLSTGSGARVKNIVSIATVQRLRVEGALD